jgi:alkylhydroperoxidase family enzyme
MTSEPTCHPVADVDWPERLTHLKGGFATSLNVYRVMANHPDLLAAWAPLRGHVVQTSALGPERSEIVILRTGHRLGSAYEWAHHVCRARALGLSDSRIASIAEPLDRMAPEDALLSGAVDSLFDTHGLDTERRAELVQAIGREAMFDLIATVGFYSTLGYILNTCHPPLDDDIAAALAEHPLAPR